MNQVQIHLKRKQRSVSTEQKLDPYLMRFPYIHNKIQNILNHLLDSYSIERLQWVDHHKHTIQLKRLMPIRSEGHTSLNNSITERFGTLFI